MVRKALGLINCNDSCVKVKGTGVDAAIQKPKEPSQQQIQPMINLYKQGQHQQALHKAQICLKIS